MTFTLRAFFRRMPNAALARYFEAKGIAHGLDVAELPESSPEPWMQVWDALPEGKHVEMAADFQEIEAMSCEAGFLAVLHEVQRHMKDLPEQAQAIVEKLAGLSGHHERAMAAFLDHPGYWRSARKLEHVGALNYSKRGGLPRKNAAVDVPTLQRFARLIGEHFYSKDGRGRNCKVEPLRFSDKDVFFAYPEDHADRPDEWVNGELRQRARNRAFEVVFVYCKDEGSLDICCKGGKKTVQAMQRIFGQAILGLEELPVEDEGDEVYDLLALTDPALELVCPLGSSIRWVRVRKLQLASERNDRARITLEADPSDDPQAVHKLLAEAQKAFPQDCFSVMHVELVALIEGTNGKRDKRKPIRLTGSDNCSLKYDGLDGKLRGILSSAGIERQKLLPLPHEADATHEDDNRPGF